MTATGTDYDAAIDAYAKAEQLYRGTATMSRWCS